MLNVEFGSNITNLQSLIVNHKSFIGNSYTYYHSMPYLFKAMAENKFSNRRVDVQFIGEGGATLQQHWEEGRAPKAIKTGRWGFVVLQEQIIIFIIIISIFVAVKGGRKLFKKR